MSTNLYKIRITKSQLRILRGMAIRDEWLQEGLQIFFNHMSRATLEGELTMAGFTLEEVEITEDTPENEGLKILFAYARKASSQ